MPITLTPEQERHINSIAKQRRKPAEVVLNELLTAETPEEQTEIEDRTLELFAQWEREDTQRLATMTPEEIAAEDVRDAELLRSLETSRISLRVPDISAHD